MFFFSFFHYYLWWHYSTSLVSYIRVSRNFWWYFFHIFSIPQLTATLFYPYKRIIERPSNHFSFGDLFERTVLNLFSRLVGVIIRISILIIGTLTILIYTVFSLAGFAIWLGTPILICFGVFVGGWLLFI